MNVYELIVFTKRLLSDGSSRVFGSPAACLEHVQAAYNKLHGKFTAIDAGHCLLLKDYTWVTPSDTTYEAEYHLPRNCEAIKSVALLNSSGRIVDLAVPHDLVTLQAREAIPQHAYYFRRNTLVIRVGAVNSSSSISTVRVHYYRTPADLAVFEPPAVAGQAITLPGAPVDGLGKIHAFDGAYEGTEFEVVAGPGVGEVYEIVSYVGSTKVATVRTGTTVSATTSSRLSVLPAIPERAHPLIGYMTALDGARIEENRRAYQLMRDEIDMLWRNIEGTLTLRQVQAALAVQSGYD